MKRDRPIKADYERLADLAEKGFDPSTFHAPRRGRPSLGSSGVSPRVAARVSAEVHEVAKARAASEGRTMSQVLRGLVEDYANGSTKEPTAEPAKAGGSRRRRRA